MVMIRDGLNSWSEDRTWASELLLTLFDKTLTTRQKAQRIIARADYDRERENRAEKRWSAQQSDRKGN